MTQTFTKGYNHKVTIIERQFYHFFFFIYDALLGTKEQH
ncbi:hypothetical protein B4166_1082 [Caldibacillus thermoamylovorans]|uniref:Uncharacterized protein n=1 Tax=Caldibacillus thermoamylovorans TaxID=35841 RepID=A0ABD4A6Q3_9BACI|nr:hypothetical protein B4166_1082 [Caldibacillus thermoamylovorans]KIO72494.1 hypothetical protein B4167_1184 [Caldibacillus thermoamylovorans]